MRENWIRQRETVIAHIFAYYQDNCIKKFGAAFGAAPRVQRD